MRFFSAAVGATGIESRKALVVCDHPQLSVERQCELMRLSKSTYYYHAVPIPDEQLTFLRLLDEQYLKTPILWES